MAELTRGAVADRPWGITFGALGMRGLSGQLTLAAEGKLFCVAFSGGAVVGATSPLLNDAAVRVALTGGLVSSTQAADISRRLAGQPDRDEIIVIGEHLRLTPDQTQRLRRRVVAQRAARTFSIQQGDFIVEDRVKIPLLGSELDIRAVVYLGARANLTEERLDADLSALGAWFQIKREALGDLPQYGFTETEKPILELLVNGANLVDLESAHPEVDARSARAIVYALVSCGACEIAAQPRGNPRVPRPPTPPPIRNVTPPTGVRAVTRAPTANPTRATPPGGTAIPRTSTPSSSRPALDLSPVPTRGSDEGRPKPSTTSPPRAGSSPGPMTPRDGVTAVTKGSSPGFPRAPTKPQIDGEEVVRLKAPSGAPAMTLKPLTDARAQRHSSHPPAIRQRKDDAATQETEMLIAEKLLLVDAGADHFTLLEVSREAMPDQIRTAYFNLARKLHPDRLAALGITDARRDAQRLFAQVNAAFSHLSDPARLASYLDLLGRGGEAAVRAEQARADEIASKIMRAEEAFRRGEMAMRRDQLDQAVADFKSALELQPNEPEYMALLAWAKFAAAPDKPAVAAETRIALGKAADAAERSVTARFYLGRVERMLGREKEALGHFQHVLMLKPNHGEAQSEVRVLESRLKGKR